MWRTMTPLRVHTEASDGNAYIMNSVFKDPLWWLWSLCYLCRSSVNSVFKDPLWWLWSLFHLSRSSVKQRVQRSSLVALEPFLP